MLPGKKYTPQEAIRLLTRYRWYLLVPPMVGLFGGLLVSRVLPNRYQSDALIQVIPQRISDKLVNSSVTMRIEDRMSAIQLQIRSRTQLEAIIRKFNLYPAPSGQAASLDSQVGRLNGAIRVEPASAASTEREADKDSFRVRFSYSDAETAKNVTEYLAQLFILQNQRDRGDIAEATSSFLETQLVEARTRLEAQEAKVKQFRERYSGRLPTQMESNLSSLQRLQAQLENVAEQIARDRDQKLMFERLYRDLEAEPVVVPNVPRGSAEPGAATAGLTVQQQLKVAEEELTRMELRLTPEHPDVLRQKRLIRDLRAKVASAPADSGAGGPAPQVVSPEESARRARLRERQNDIERLDRQIKLREDEERRVRQQISDYEGRVASVPGLESEWTALSRDYDTLQSAYRDLLAKSEQSKVSANLERRQIGEQFKLIDPPRVAWRPSSPNRLRINAIGLAVGLALGLGLIVLSELRDTSFRNEADVHGALSLPVLAMVPWIETEAGKLARQRRQQIVAAASAAGALTMAVTFVYLRLWHYLV